MAALFKAYTKGYVGNSCLAPPLNLDSEAVRHSANLQALISYEHLRVWLFSIKIEFTDIHKKLNNDIQCHGS